MPRPRRKSPGPTPGPAVYAADHIPTGLRPYFQEYDPDTLELQRHANLIIERTLEFGTWDDLRWLVGTYGLRRLRRFLRQFGERGLRPATFNYWRRLLGIRQWRHTPLSTPKGELWNP